ncbi:hypothetical protein IAD21_03213 [Abditibacteriota bacterium]|nr:hypothetical protein IAD21_03213 [Abditibacteriota bacterium]
MSRFGLPDFPGFVPKFAGMTARFFIFVQPQMNHLVFENFS